MKAKELVGKWIEARFESTRLGKPVDTAFKVIGYSAYMGWAIVGADDWGWKILGPDDIIAEKCETYWYVRLAEITKVL